MQDMREPKERPGDEQAWLQPLRARSCVAFLAAAAYVLEVAAGRTGEAGKADRVASQTWN